MRYLGSRASANPSRSVGIAAVGERRPFGVLDELEPIDGLRLVVFEQLEVGGGQARDRPPVPGGVGIDADEMGAAPEGWWPLRIRLLILRRRSLRRQRGGRQQESTHDRSDSQHRGPPAGGVGAYDYM